MYLLPVFFTPYLIKRSTGISTAIFPFELTMSENSDTIKTKCVPCESLDPSALLSVEKAQEELANLKLWTPSITTSDKVDNISRKFTAKNFELALDSINEIGVIAEREGHHPDLHLTSYRDVEIVIYTHSVGGITQNDLKLAKMFDEEVKYAYSPKWLKENPDAQSTAK